MVVAASDGGIGAGSRFSGDRCKTYFYQPGWTTLPNPDKDQAVAAINGDWYTIDYCR